MKGTARRRLAMESLESRLPLDAAGMGPDEPVWERVIVSFRDDVQDLNAAAQQVLAPLSGRLGHLYEHSLRGFSAQIPATAAAGLAHHPLIAQVEADLVMQAFQQTLPTGVDRINAELNGTGGAIGSGKAVDVDIAIIDTGIAPHGELNVVGGHRFYTVTGGPPKFRGSFNDANYADDNGHGTHVAGIAAARDNDTGGVGVAPGARLWAVKVLDSGGSGYMSDIIAGVDWVTDRAAEIEVANMSLGGTGKSDLLHQSIKASVAAGVVYVVAAGNDWGDIHGPDGTYGTSDDVIPAAYPEVATISAFADSDGRAGGQGDPTSWGQHGQDDAWWHPSNFSNGDGVNNEHFLAANPVTSPGLGIDLALPGVDITSTWLGGGYHTISGTSMAAPHAAGMAALQIAANGRATDAAGVHAIRQAMIDGGQAWTSDQGLANLWGPDRHAENIGWAEGSLAPVAPAVSIISPTNIDAGNPAVVAGSVTVSAMAEAFGDGVAVSEVVLLVDGDAVDAVSLPDPEGTWSLTWNTLDDQGAPRYADSLYSLNVQVTDTAGRTGSDTITVLLDNVIEFPAVSIVSPAAGSNVSGVLTLTAAASDDVEVADVEFFLAPAGDTSGAGESLGSAQPNGDGTWVLPWDSTVVPGGDYTLRVTATDNGNRTTVSEVLVTVDNSVAAIHAVLSGTAAQINRNFWQASATVKVVDAGGTAQPGAVVTGRWVETGAIVTGTSDASGQVSFNSGNLRDLASIDFTVEAIELAGFAYTETSHIRIFKSGEAAGFTSGLAAPMEPRVDAADASDDTWRTVPLADSVDRLMAGDELHAVVARRGSQAPPPRGDIRLLREDTETPDAPDASDLEASFLTSEIDL